MTVQKSRLEAGATRATRKRHTFNGGIHPDGHKDVSNAAPIVTLPLLSRYVVPLRQHIGTATRVLVQAGDTVLRGQMIGAAEGYVSTAVHAPTSGRVVAVEPHEVPHPSGLADLCVVIESDGLDQAVEFQPLDWRNLDPSALRNRIRDLGLAGLGGAVFPSFIKLNPEGGGIDTLILNGAECEPWITCDDRLMRERAAEILQGVAVMRHMLGAREVLIGIEDDKPEAIAAMRTAAGADTGVEVVAVPTLYPSGGGKQLTYLLTGRETPTGGRSTDVGVQVFNIGTAHALYRAVALGEPMLSRVVTVTGHVATPGNYEARLGTPVADLLQAAGGALPGSTGKLVGGPMMGFELEDNAAPLTKAVNCIIVKHPDLFPARPAALPCIRCGACARACPADLQPFEMYWFARAKDFGKAQSYDLFDCIECGCCSFVCPSHIPLVDYFRFAKSEIWERERHKHDADQARTRHEFKEFRLEREKLEKAEKLAAKVAENKARDAAAAATAAANPDAAADPEAERKKAILQAALDRAKKAKEAVTPQNTESLPPAVEKQIAEIEARRAQADTAVEKEAGQ
ncbi:MAG: electron transport complex subunit RsxC [Pseudomonadota bacterium]|nr:electron transport complex subunit RsxC [Pseudomonadota bacterium]MDP1904319.1 electron transport complex subunit RsxC [Pseudomonadota bacterium]MDP2352395.1 electron transport complex subunit RsxC [Pseudomonadota bacterium]